MSSRVYVCVGMKSFRLIACREDGTLEQQTVELTWNTILRWESDEESMAFCFEYSRNEKPPRWVKVYTPYVSIIQVNYYFIFSKEKRIFLDSN